MTLVQRRRLTSIKRTPAWVRTARRLVIDSQGCWIFTGALDQHGYGRVGSDRMDDEFFDPTMQKTHRVLYEHIRGPIPEGLVLDHLCRKPPCCNPAHLEAVTQAENTRRSLWATSDKCKRGHQYTPENTALVKGRTPDVQWRHCRTCWAAATRASRERRKARNARS